MDRIEDWQACCKEYAKNTELTFTFKNGFTGWIPQCVNLFGWHSWTTNKSRLFNECRIATMLEF